jgi:hypothetical protein
LELPCHDLPQRPRHSMCGCSSGSDCMSSRSPAHTGHTRHSFNESGATSSVVMRGHYPRDASSPQPSSPEAPPTSGDPTDISVEAPPESQHMKRRCAGRGQGATLDAAIRPARRRRNKKEPGSRPRAPGFSISGTGGGSRSTLALACGEGADGCRRNPFRRRTRGAGQIECADQGQSQPTCEQPWPPSVRCDESLRLMVSSLGCKAVLSTSVTRLSR